MSFKSTPLIFANVNYLQEFNKEIKEKVKKTSFRRKVQGTADAFRHAVFPEQPGNCPNLQHLRFYALSMSMNLFFISAFLSSVSPCKKVSSTTSKAASAFTLICVFPALKPADSSFFGSKALLKFPSLIIPASVAFI